MLARTVASFNDNLHPITNRFLRGVHQTCEWALSRSVLCRAADRVRTVSFVRDGSFPTLALAAGFMPRFLSCFHKARVYALVIRCRSHSLQNPESTISLWVWNAIIFFHWLIYSASGINRRFQKGMPSVERSNLNVSCVYQVFGPLVIAASFPGTSSAVCVAGEKNGNLTESLNEMQPVSMT